MGAPYVIEISVEEEAEKSNLPAADGTATFLYNRNPEAFYVFLDQLLVGRQCMIIPPLAKHIKTRVQLRLGLAL